jgi:biotin operon repressor
MSHNAPPSAGEVRALASQLLSWADHLSSRAAAETLLTEDEQRELAVSLAEAARDAALLRARSFPGVQLGNVAWDVILELFIRTERGFRVSLDNLTLECGASADAIHSSIQELRTLGVVVETPDRFNSGEAWLSLSGEDSRRVTSLLIEAARDIQARNRALGAQATIAPNVSHSA